MSPANPPTQAPTATELLANPVVQAALDQAWIDSQADNPATRHEEGGWIYLDLTTSQITTVRATRGILDGINLNNPPIVSDSIVVGKLHTHPNPELEGWTQGPSPSDIVVDARHGVPDLIRAENGVHISGPSSRRGGLAGGPGFPP
jgi:hypothetical protein